MPYNYSHLDGTTNYVNHIVSYGDAESYRFTGTAVGLIDGHSLGLIGQSIHNELSFDQKLLLLEGTCLS